MSFGFGVGDFIATGELCWKLYSNVYKVSRDAPEELRGLSQELGNLSNTIKLLNEELEAPDSCLANSGEQRLKFTRRIMSQARETLEKMERLSKKYADLKAPDNTAGVRRPFRISWSQIKYSKEARNINDLRSKLMIHNSQLTLLLQGAQKTNAKLDELRELLVHDRSSREQPLLSVPLDDDIQSELGAAFLRHAESGDRPWASIGIDEWPQAGKWWLLKAQSQLNRPAPPTESQQNQAYVDLLKACWILTDIISLHPQRAHLGASSDRRNGDIRYLSQMAKINLEGFSGRAIQLGVIETCNLDIWNKSSSSSLAPRRCWGTNRKGPSWQTIDGEILYQCFAEHHNKLHQVAIECIVILEVPKEGFHINFIAQTFSGRDILKTQIHPDKWLMWRRLVVKTDAGPFKLVDESDRCILDAIFEGLRLFGSAFRPTSLSASIMYSVSVLAHGANDMSGSLSYLEQSIEFQTTSNLAEKQFSFYKTHNYQ
ncbi:hypothetical protein F53441_7411 [Fusarium austroafricanum]|uniref:Fungal N-terminal domain-containing protein n=1 Tax=Fusarium austroafricanum TaxID=2364996 RepID=A0A8H4KHE2_9HYPO|nr:hypothetical protein F53441_7411 [Fusarium austroafricanum]